MNINTSIRHAAEAYTRAVDELAELKAFTLDSPGQVRVTWDFGAATPGYTALSLAISQSVQEGWQILRAGVIEEAERKVKLAHDALAEALKP